MCDFRNITKIRLLQPTRDHNIYDIIDTSSHKCMAMEEVEKYGSPGLYLIPGSGCGYSYWTGSGWLDEGTGYKVEEWKQYDCWHV